MDQTMGGDSVVEACCGICCLACCESILVYLNFKKPGARVGSTQRGCCNNCCEPTEDDEFEEQARMERIAKSSKKRKDQNRDEGNEEKSAKEGEEGGVKTVNDQPEASPEMTAPLTDVATKV